MLFLNYILDKGKRGNWECVMFRRYKV